MSCFKETPRFPEDISRDATGGPIFATVVVESASGAESRNANWSKGRYRFDVSHAQRTIAQMDELVAFFVNVSGRLCGFRFKDWSDYSSKVGGTQTKHTTVSISGTTFQLVKRYTTGGLTYVRNIRKPVSTTLGNTAATQADSTVKVYDGSDVEVTSGWTIDCTTGIITFSGAPGYTPKATFEFDVPCRFESDEMKVQQADVAIRHWQHIGLIEDRFA